MDVLHAALKDDTWRLLVEIDIESGMRWGELIELRPLDFDFETRVVTVRRVAIEVSRRFHPDGGRFLVKDYPKDAEHRQFRVSRSLIRKIMSHIKLWFLSKAWMAATIGVTVDSAVLSSQHYATRDTAEHAWSCLTHDGRSTNSLPSATYREHVSQLC